MFIKAAGRFSLSGGCCWARIAGRHMKFNPVVVRAVMHTQFQELRAAGKTVAPGPDNHYPFTAEDVEDLYFNRGTFGKGVWFRLKDGRIFDVMGEVAAPATTEALIERRAIPEDMSDFDAMDALPLSLIPLSTRALKSARLIKNARLETAVEIHRDARSGSLQIRPEDVPSTFPGSRDDHRIISELATLHTYDVYSLRASLKKLGIAADRTSLDLSSDLKEKLQQFSAEFTRPLLQNIYGDGTLDPTQDLGRLFRGGRTAQAAQRLKAMSERTGIPVEEIPAFLETYSDLFLSVIYYRHNFDNISMDIDRCSSWLKDISLQRDAAASAQSAAHYRHVDETLRLLSTSIRGRLNGFRRAFDVFWRDMNRDTLGKLQREIETRHETTGGMLCGLVVKMRHWSRTFHSRTSGGPSTRLQYVTAEMEPGLDKLCKLM
jgi:hypothetical protein